jgi:hypothetical protein
MQVHHRFDIKVLISHAVNDGVGKAMKVEFAVVVLNIAPAFRFGQNAMQRGLIFLKKVAPKPGWRSSYQSAAASNSGQPQDAG